jgi:hypothetical protein
MEEGGVMALHLHRGFRFMHILYHGEIRLSISPGQISGLLKSTGG